MIAKDQLQSYVERIERLTEEKDGIASVELFARQRRPGWDCWGNQVDKFGAYNAADDSKKSYEVCLEEIRTRKAAGGPGYTPKTEAAE